MKVIISIMIIIQSMLATDSLNKWGIWISSDDLTLNKQTYTLDEILEVFEPRAAMIALIENISEYSLYLKLTTKRYKKHIQKYWKEDTDN